MCGNCTLKPGEKSVLHDTIHTNGRACPPSTCVKHFVDIYPTTDAFDANLKAMKFTNIHKRLGDYPAEKQRLINASSQNPQALNMSTIITPPCVIRCSTMPDYVFSDIFYNNSDLYYPIPSKEIDFNRYNKYKINTIFCSERLNQQSEWSHTWIPDEIYVIGTSGITNHTTFRLYGGLYVNTNFVSHKVFDRCVSGCSSDISNQKFINKSIIEENKSLRTELKELRELLRDQNELLVTALANIKRLEDRNPNYDADNKASEELTEIKKYLAVLINQ